MKPITEVAATLGLDPAHLEPYGNFKAKISLQALSGRKPQGRLILVSAITPTPAGEGKTTTSIGLVQGLTLSGVRAMAALREPSLGPYLGMKGGGSGGGRSQVEPAVDVNLHFNGDIHAVSSSHNLLAAMVDNSLHHGNPLGLDSRRVVWKRVLDMNDRALRDIVIGLGGRSDGVPRETGFDITAASEVMAILCLADGIADLKQRLGRIVVGYRQDGSPVRAADLEAVGAMAVLLRDAIKPNLVQTTEGAPAVVHGGPFANIAHGTNSITATKLALAYTDAVVTEAGFAFELGAEKFFDINCRYGGFAPSCTVLVATVRALKMHGGLPLAEIATPDPAAVGRGLENLDKHVENIRKFEQRCVVAINRFPGDTEDEIAVVREHCDVLGLTAVPAEPFTAGGRRLPRAGGGRVGGGQARQTALPAALRLERFDREEDRDRGRRDVRGRGRRLSDSGATRQGGAREAGLRQAAGVHRQDAAVALGQSRAAGAAQGLPGHRARDPAGGRRRVPGADHRRDPAHARTAHAPAGRAVRPIGFGGDRLRERLGRPPMPRPRSPRKESPWSRWWIFRTPRREAFAACA